AQRLDRAPQDEARRRDARQFSRGSQQDFQGSLPALPLHVVAQVEGQWMMKIYHSKEAIPATGFAQWQWPRTICSVGAPPLSRGEAPVARPLAASTKAAASVLLT